MLLDADGSVHSYNAAFAALLGEAAQAPARELLAPLAPLALMGADDGGGEGQTDEGRADEERRGMAYYAASTVWASLMGVCVKAATRNGTGVLFVIAARCAVGIGLALAVLRHENLSPLGNNRRLLVTRGAVGCGGIIGLLIGMDRLPLVACSLSDLGRPGRRVARRSCW